MSVEGVYHLGSSQTRSQVEEEPKQTKENAHPAAAFNAATFATLKTRVSKFNGIFNVLQSVCESTYCYL